MEPPSKVVFHENPGFDPMPIPRPEPPTLARRIMNLGITNSPGDAAIIVAVSASLLIAVNVYLFAKAVPVPPVLGEDRLRVGEVVPAHIQSPR